MTCPDACYQAPRSCVRQVVVLDVMSSARGILSARTCRIRAETRGRGCPPPVFVQASGPLSAASQVVYKTAALPEHNLQVHASLITAIRDRDTTALAKLRMLCRPDTVRGPEPRCPSDGTSAARPHDEDAIDSRRPLEPAPAALRRHPPSRSAQSAITDNCGTRLDYDSTCYGMTRMGMTEAGNGGRFVRTLEPTSVVDQVSGEIRRSILSGALRPGQQFSLREIASQLGVSFIPVREALRQLEAQGLVVTRPGRSASVAP